MIESKGNKARIRVSICRNSGKNQGKILAVVVVEPTWIALCKAVANKLKIGKSKRKNLRLFVASATQNSSRGHELKSNTDLSTILENGIVLAASWVKNEQFLGKTGLKSSWESNVPKPPRWPWPAGDRACWKADTTLEWKSLEQVEAEAEPKTIENGTGLKSVSLDMDHGRFLADDLSEINDDVGSSFEMCGQFPVLRGDVTKAVMTAISGCNAFVVKRNKYLSFDYRDVPAKRSAAVFPSPLELTGKSKKVKKMRYYRAVRRECRGLILDQESGKVLARRFHKFFNIGENYETDWDSIMSRFPSYQSLMNCGCVFTEKIDGSLASPFILKREIVWATRSESNADIAKFAERDGYNLLASSLLGRGLTPIFEWCRPGPPVAVIEHDSPTLTLLAIRNNVTGSYYSWNEMQDIGKQFGVPVVRRVDPVEELQLSAKQFTLADVVTGVTSWGGGHEGVVASFEDGTRFKIKTDWYNSLASALKEGGDTLLSLLNRHPTLENVPSYLIYQTVLASEKIDDVLAQASSILCAAKRKNDAQKLHDLVNNLSNGISKLQNELRAWAVSAESDLLDTKLNQEVCKLKSARSQIASIAVKAGWDVQLIYMLLENQKVTATKSIIRTLKNLWKLRQLDALQALTGVRWDDSLKSVTCGKVSNAFSVQKWTLFVDLDGVLADFDAEIQSLCGKSSALLSQNKVWKIAGQRGFFQNLPPMVDYRILWNALLSLVNDGRIKEIKILTGLPKGRLGKRVKLEKAKWVKKYLWDDSNKVQMLTSLGPKTPNVHPAILIDDSDDSHRSSWTSHGGIFIHHKSASSTLKKLNKILGNHEVVKEDDLNRELPQKIAWKIDMVVVDTEAKLDKFEVLAQELSVNGGKVALGFEWATHDSLNSNLLPEYVPIAVSEEKVFILKSLSSNWRSLDALKWILYSDKIIKLAWGLDDMFERLGFDGAQSMVDLEKHYLCEHLTDAVEEVLKRRLKPKIDVEQAIDLWYVASKIAVLHALHNALDYDKSSTLEFFPESSMVSKGFKKSGDKARQLSDLKNRSVRFAGIFLNERSRNQLPILKYSRKFSDHVTLSWEPLDEVLDILPVGLVMELETKEERWDGRIHVLSVMIKPHDKFPASLIPINPHITLSCANNVSPNEALSLFESHREEVSREIHTKPKVLTGVVGACFASARKYSELLDPSCLPEKIVQKIRKFVDDAVPSSILCFKPGELNGFQRKIIHEFAAEKGFHTRSEGRWDKRQLCCSIPKHGFKASKTKSKDHKSLKDRYEVITDAGVWAALRPSNRTSRRKYDGELILNGVRFGSHVSAQALRLKELVSAKVKHPTVIILRGLPGVGKSWLAKKLKQVSRGVIVSGDHYFEEGGMLNRKQLKGLTLEEIYEKAFDEQLLRKAHQLSRERFIAALNDGVEVVIVDNNNVKRKSYAWFLRTAEKEGYEVIVVEILSWSRDERCWNQSLHDVPLGVIMKKAEDWEPHQGRSRPVRLKPYHGVDWDFAPIFRIAPLKANACETLSKWLSAKKEWVHQNLTWPKTHLKTGLGREITEYLNIPHSMRTAFHKHYIAGSGTPQFYSEVANERFRMFFDINWHESEPLVNSDILELSFAIQAAVKVKTRVLVTGFMTSRMGSRSGIHIHLPGLVVSTEEAVELQQMLAARLPDRLGRTINPSIYRHLSVRMLGSSKVSEGEDCGRVYGLIVVLTEEGHVDRERHLYYQNHPAELLADVSIHE